MKTVFTVSILAAMCYGLVSFVSAAVDSANNTVGYIQSIKRWGGALGLFL